MSVLTEKLISYGCNIEEAMGRFLDNEVFYEKCFVKFVQEKSFVSLDEALKSGEVKAAFEYAHDLKGISANMGITPIYDLVVQLVEPLRKGTMPEDARQIMDQILAMRDELAKFVA